MTEFETSIPVADNIHLELMSTETINIAVPLFDLINRNREQLSQFGDTTADKYPTLQAVFDSIAHPRNPARERYAIIGDGDLVGSINVEPTGEKDTAYELGYWLGKEYEGHGYMTLATRGLATHVLARPGARLISAYTHPDNIASQHVLLRSGFVFHSEPRGQHRYVATRQSLRK